MLTIDYVKGLVDRHQKKAAEHIELLEEKKMVKLMLGFGRRALCRIGLIQKLRI